MAKGRPRRARSIADPTSVLAHPVRSLIALLLCVPTVLMIGWREPIVEPQLLWILQALGLGLYGLLFFREIARLLPEDRAEILSISRPEQVCVALGLLLVWVPDALKLACAVLLVVHIARVFLRLVQTSIPPGLVFLGSFLALTLAGTFALMLPAATPERAPIGFIDALFTITSAISQTGLIVRPTGLVLGADGEAIDGFTRFGQIIILLWIQIGALGVIVFGALLVNVLGSSFGLRATQTLAEGTEQGWSGQLSLQRLVTFIIVFTHLVELLGAVFLYFAWPDTWPGMPVDMETAGDRMFHAVFFSVSAFCNAGFVTTADSLVGLRTHGTTHLVIAPLIVLGSIGFPVLDNIRRVMWDRFRGIRTDRAGNLVRFNLNTKIVIAATIALYLIGFGLTFASELNIAGARGVEAGLATSNIPTAALDAHFMSINRTAGFNSLQVDQLGVLAHLGFIFLMFVGGSPGSVAGGIKVMVFAVLALTVWSTIRGRSETTAFGRTIPDVLVRKSATLIVLALILLLVGTGILVVADPEHSLQEHMFEASSALATCGLTLGVTGDLSDVGRLTVSALMFIGRVGPMAVLAALFGAAASRRPRMEYPEEEVVIY